jgi:aminopeptidase-like protein
MLTETLNISEIQNRFDPQESGREIHGLMAELYPICRSITGDGFRRTLERLRREIPIEVHEVPSGTRVFDWTVPREWNIRDAYVKNAQGERVIDFQKHNLHILNYSVPIHRKMELGELKKHLHSLPDQPDLIPYRTSYYSENWGFCLAHRDLMQLEEGDYEVEIDSSLEDGHLTFGEYFVAGQSSEEVLISCHACHPSLSNDNLSGVAVATFLAKRLSGAALRYSYRFLFIPGTIGAITWLCLNEERIPEIRHGLVLTCVGDRGRVTYKKSRRGDAEIDRAAMHVLEHSGERNEILEFSPYGYDERQYCSPAFNLPVGCLMRTPHGRFPEYHTSADNMDFVDPAALADTFAKCLAIFSVLENNRVYLNRNPKCEPQLGKRGLYSALGGAEVKQLELAMLWVLNLSDGGSSLLDVAERSGLRFDLIQRATDLLEKHDLLEKPMDPAGSPKLETRVVKWTK